MYGFVIIRQSDGRQAHTGTAFSTRNRAVKACTEKALSMLGEYNPPHDAYITRYEKKVEKLGSKGQWIPIPE